MQPQKVEAYPAPPSGGGPRAVNPQAAKRRRGVVIFIVLAAIALAAVGIFLTWGLTESNVGFFLPRRARKVWAIAMTGSAIGIGSLVFQTITNNRILTPSIMGLDNLYLLMQTVVAYFWGAQTLTMTSAYTDFAISTGLMVGFSVLLCSLIFRRGDNNLFVLVLVGMVCGSFFSSMSTFMQAIIDPNEFQILQGSMYASFNNVNTDLLVVSTVVIVLCLAYIFATHRKLDVLALGREHSVNLGLNYNVTILIYLMLVSLMIAVSTALVGPITFLGVLVVNLARQIFDTYRHWILALGSALLSVIFLVGGQFLVERVFKFETTVSVLVNLIGGTYFIFLLLKERRV